MKNVQSAIIGLGRMGWRRGIKNPNHLSRFMKPLAHIEALQEHEQTKIVACAEVNREVASEFESTYGIKVHTCHRELLRAHELDLITIATRTAEIQI